ncbi:MAG: myo-inositol 2-dehydrogenase/D-chiro-inositol 1-dehydrogenase [Acidimicrobiales bacterium]
MHSATTVLAASIVGPSSYSFAMEEIRYGVIGTGMMGIEHIENLSAVDGATVTAVSDPDATSLANGAKTVGNGVATFSDHRDLIDANVCDAVVLVSPNYTHHAVLSDLLASDLHVLTEKPMCISTEECLDVVAAAQGRSALTWVGLEYRYMPPVSRLVDEVHSGTVGNVHMVSIREHRFPFLTKVGDWNRFTRNTGGTLVEKCCHYFDLMNLITGQRPVSVMASGGQNVNHLDEVYDGEQSDILDNAYVIVEYPNNVRAMLDLCMFAEATRNQEELSVVGDAGKVEALIPQNTLRIGHRGEHFINDVIEEPISNDNIKVPGLHHGSSYLEHVDFADAIRNNTAPKVDVIDGLWSVAIGEAAHRSIAEHRPISLAEILPPEFL